MSLPYFPMFPTDFEADTSHLTLEEDGAYNRLLRLCWMTPGCSLPDDDGWIMRRMRCDADTFERVVRVILDEFFQRKSGRVFSPRLAKEWQKSDLAHKRRVSAGSKGGKAKSLKSNEQHASNAKAKPKQPEPEPEPLREEPKGSLCGFDDFWTLWPDKSKKEPARKSWKRLSLSDRRDAYVAVRDGWFDRWRQSRPDASPIHASTFLNQKRWTDELQPKFTAINGGGHAKPAAKSQDRVTAFVSGARGSP